MSDKIKLDFFAEFNAIEWKTYTTLAAIKAFEEFWMESEALIDKAADDSEKNSSYEPDTGNETDDYYERRKVARYLHDEIVRPTHRYAATITLFALIERELKRYGDNLAKATGAAVQPRDLRGGLFEQLVKYTELFGGFRLSDAEFYAPIKNLQKIRNCLVHAYGEASAMAEFDKNYLLKLSFKIPGVEINAGSPIFIGPEFIAFCINATRGFFLEVFNKTGWKINDKWLPDGGK
jgi:hypothetical protein